MNVYPFIEAEKQGVGSVATACRLVEVSGPSWPRAVAGTAANASPG